jgi:hypothetical protein
MSLLESLKKSRSNSLDKLRDQLAKVNGNKSYSDDKYWKPETDKVGNGFAIIRFLPAPEGEDFSFVKLYDHGFKGPGGWYIENSRTTIGKEDPVSEYNFKLWNSGIEANKEEVHKQRRRTSFHANVYIVKDSANPDNEGKVFLYKFGKKIMEKLTDAMNPQYEGDDPVNPFDIFEGADFKLKIRNVEGYPNYDRSEFAACAPMADGNGRALTDEQLEDVLKSLHSLKDIVDPKNFKSYDELKAKLHKVLGLDGGGRAPTVNSAEDDDMEVDVAPSLKTRSAPRMEELPPPSQFIDDDDDTMDIFKNLIDD